MFASGKTASASSGASSANYIEDVFSTYLYDGNATARNIQNGIDLAGKGGMVWIKTRTQGTTGWNHVLYDTNRGANKFINSNLTNAENSSFTDMLTGFNSNGFSLGVDASTYLVNQTGYGGYASWTFRKQPKFFDVVTYTGDGTSGRTVAHNLGSVPGCMIVKRTDTTANWVVFHRGTGGGSALFLNLTSASSSSNSWWNSTNPTATDFTVGNAVQVNAAGGTYVAYLFAHNAGGFGLTGTDNVISCGTFTTDASGLATVNLGYEPQWVLAKNSTGTAANWLVVDSMRGMSVTSDADLYPNLSSAEGTSSNELMPDATGFSVGGGLFGPSKTYIYIAIRRGPMKVPTDGTSVFAPVAYTGDGTNGVNISAGITADAGLFLQRTPTYPILRVYDRLRGKERALTTTSDSAEVTASLNGEGEFTQSGAIVSSAGNASANLNGRGNVLEFFKRAPSFMDVVCYTGTGSARTINHNLGAVPELMIMKNRSTTGAWYTYVASLGVNEALQLNQNFAQLGFGYWNSTAPTSSVFSIGAGSNNDNGVTYVAYLFATCAGVSKVGSYTGTGTTKQVDCGFTGGARFVLIKRTDSTGDWYVWDSARGIVSGNDPYLLLNSSATEVTSTDYVDTYSAGFEISSTAPAAINASGGTFIFLAIA